MGLACITWQYLVGFVVSSVLVWSVLNYNSEEFKNYFNRFILNIIISFICVFIIFLLTIDFELTHFIDVFRKCISFRRGKQYNFDTINLLSFGNGYFFRLPIVITSLIITIVLLYRGYREISISH